MLSHADLDTELHALLAAPGWYVGFSGGVDSTVLLHLLQQWRAAHAAAPPLHAIHVNHGLQPAATDWQRHCENVCTSLDVPLLCAAVEVGVGGSVEAAARAARYAVFEAQLPSDAVLFLGHHLDDQVETFFLRLMRGAGVEGLSGIPRQRRLGRGRLMRPLLGVARSDIEHYAQCHQLAHVADPSNADTALDRNFLRLQVLPLLASRWPGYRRSVDRASRHLAAASAVLTAELGVPTTIVSVLGDAGLSLEPLLADSAPVAMTRLRLWLRAIGCLPPDTAPLAEFLRQLRASGSDAAPQLVCSGYTLQRYREGIYSVPAWDAPPPPVPLALAAGARLRVAGVGAISLQPSLEAGLALAPGEELTLHWRRGGERCRLPGRSGSRRLKLLWQEWRIPPWWRDRVPLLYLGEELLAVGDIAHCASSRWRVRAQAGEQLWTLRWDRAAGAGSD